MTEESDTFFICEHCLADNELKEEVIARGLVIERCPICHHTGGRALDAEDPMLRRIFRALVRLNFSEWDYNGHLGGESLETVALESKTIFSLGRDASELDFEDAYLKLEGDGWYPDNEGEISLGGGYWDGGILDGLRHRRDREVNSLVAEALEKNWFEAEPAARKLIQDLHADIASVVPAGTEFFRGRVGVKARARRDCLGPVYGHGFHYLPYTGKDIDRPPLKLATEGRFNRARVTLLYLASDVETAVAELRPHPGHLVSTASFRANRDLSIANFAKHDIRNFLSDSRLEDLRRILSIADVLNLPVQPEHRVLYAATQLFADAIRSAGFEGVSFRSSVGPGKNLTCFVGDAFEMIEGSEGVQDVTALKYEMRPSEVLPQNYDKDDWTEDEDSPLATLMHGMSRLG